MDVARLVLNFLEVLVWPGVVAVLLLVFRRELRAAMARLSRATLPGGVSLGFEYETVRLSPQESQARVVEEQKALPDVKASTSTRAPRGGFGQIPTDTTTQVSHGYAIEDLALTKVERYITQPIQRHVRLSRGDRSLVLDGVVPGKDGMADRIVEVKWLRDPAAVKHVVQSVGDYETLLKSYEELTGRRAQLILTIVVPQRVKEVVDTLGPLKTALAGTDWRVFVVDYEDIGFTQPSRPAV
jgi:hypothetical protein